VPGAVVAVHVRNIKERGSIQADIHKRRLHARQYLDDAAAVDIPQKLLAGVSFGVKFRHSPLFNQGDPGFVGTDMYDEFDGHTGVPPRFYESVIGPAVRLTILKSGRF
jgi:hypothetical protein